MYIFPAQNAIRIFIRYILFITISLFLTTTLIYSTTINGNIQVLENDASRYTCKLLINVDEDSSTLGNAVIRYSYNTNQLYFPPNPTDSIDYLFNSCDSCYYLTSVSQPSAGTISINIVCISGSGRSISTDLTEVVTLNFEVITPADEITLEPELRQFFSPLSSSQWDIGNWDEIPLPITLSYFSASTIEGKVKLDWETVSEINNYGFEILRTDTTENWKTIGFVQGHGTTYSPKTYSYLDEDSLCGSIRYRLKQIDNSGIYEYSSTSEVFVETITGLKNIHEKMEYALNQNYPNPFNPYTVIGFTLPEASHTKLIIYNAIGQEVKELVNGQLDAGSHDVNFDGSDLASGFYIYRLDSANYTKTMKMMLIK